RELAAGERREPGAACREREDRDAEIGEQERPAFGIGSAAEIDDGAEVRAREPARRRREQRGHAATDRPLEGEPAAAIERADEVARAGGSRDDHAGPPFRST